MGQYRGRGVQTPGDLQRCQDLRQRAFVQERDLPTRDVAQFDCYDQTYQHVMIENIETDQLVCCFRFLKMASGAALSDCYSWGFYDLQRLTAFADPILELGRFCIARQQSHPDIMRLAWGILVKECESSGVKLLVGCSSFEGANVQKHAAALGKLAASHLAPDRYAPLIKSREVVTFARDLPALTADVPADPAGALRQMPSLLRAYLAMGAWVSDHAVVDRNLDTLHVFTGVQTDLIPPGRLALLRALGRSGDEIL
jgi:putative hemolysin